MNDWVIIYQFIFCRLEKKIVLFLNLFALFKNIYFEANSYILTSNGNRHNSHSNILSPSTTAPLSFHDF